MRHIARRWRTEGFRERSCIRVVSRILHKNPRIYRYFVISPRCNFFGLQILRLGPSCHMKSNMKEIKGKKGPRPESCKLMGLCAKGSPREPPQPPGMSKQKKKKKTPAAAPLSSLSFSPTRRLDVAGRGRRPVSSQRPFLPRYAVRPPLHIASSLPPPRRTLVGVVKDEGYLLAPQNFGRRGRTRVYPRPPRALEGW